MNHTPRSSTPRAEAWGPLTEPVNPSSTPFLRLDTAGLNHHLEPTSILLRFDQPIDLRELGKPPHPQSQPESRFELIARAKPDHLDAHPQVAHAHRLSCPNAVALPGLVNAHTHLDLTSIGPQPIDPQAPFADWLAEVMVGRPTDPEALASAVRTGIELSQAGGVVAVGDIAGCPSSGLSDAAPLALAESSLSGISFVEFFAIGARESHAIEAFDRFFRELCARWPSGSRVRPGLSPHAPYTVGLAGYRASAQLAQKLGLRVCTHLAESIEERSFIADATGPQCDLLASFGHWDDDLRAIIGRGQHPIEHTLGAWEQGADVSLQNTSPLLAVHLNDLGEAEQRHHLAGMLKAAGVIVVYCPRASTYFGSASELGPHPYRELIEAGVKVCLGTDSIINLPPEQAARGITPWHDARLLVQRDGLSTHTALEAMTTLGASALGLDASRFTLEKGTFPAGLGLVELPAKSGLLGVFAAEQPPTLLLNGC